MIIMIHIFSTPERVLKLQPSLSWAAEGEATGFVTRAVWAPCSDCSTSLGNSLSTWFAASKGKKALFICLCSPCGISPNLSNPCCGPDPLLGWGGGGGSSWELPSLVLWTDNSLRRSPSVGRVDKVLWTKFRGSQTSLKASNLRCAVTENKERTEWYRGSL